MALHIKVELKTNVHPANIEGYQSNKLSIPLGLATLGITTNNIGAVLVYLFTEKSL